ncbi:SWIB/MDM2 domain protein [Coniella lustricola]|uniref:SWIB/MDM2 domain protein n=1 Tax=Coniella lustricola TaxID=2025994 RepID=A0A2T2ZS34_9PEZI|nr:SWIB/MDM2 domain protein [Coniella lustricola]
MASQLNQDEVLQYTSIIDHILKTSDLDTVSRKKVRKGLEQQLGKDLSAQKDAIKVLIEERFDAIADTLPSPPPQSNGNDSGPDGTNGVKHETDSKDSAVVDAELEDEVSQEIKVSTVPSKKRSSSMVEDEDARLARELQAQENQLARGRQTRGGHGTPKAKPKAKPKKKSSTKVKAGDDSDVDTEDSNAPKKRKAGGGFQKEFNLSFALADLVGAERMSRPQVVKKLWEHIKANDLQEPTDKRQIRCDDLMSAVFRQSSVNMFQMNKLIGNHLYPIEE